MRSSINARLPPRVEQKLADYCAKRGVKRSEAVISALDCFLNVENGGPTPYALVADLIPQRGTSQVQSNDVRALARKAFGGSRAR